jgi:hypothetical protein
VNVSRPYLVGEQEVPFPPSVAGKRSGACGGEVAAQVGETPGTVLAAGTARPCPCAGRSGSASLPDCLCPSALEPHGSQPANSRTGHASAPCPASGTGMAPSISISVVRRIPMS